MRSNNHSNALLVELLIVIMFFMLAATVLMQVFTAAEQQSVKSGQMISLLNQAQDFADQLYVSDDPVGYLDGQGFALSGENWTRQEEDTQCTTRITITDETAGAGVLRYYTVSVVNSQDEALITLNNARYREVEP